MPSDYSRGTQNRVAAWGIGDDTNVAVPQASNILSFTFTPSYTGTLERDVWALVWNRFDVATQTLAMSQLAGQFVVGFKIVCQARSAFVEAGNNGAISGKYFRLGGEIIHTHLNSISGAISEKYVPVQAPGAQFLAAMQSQFAVRRTGSDGGALSMTNVMDGTYFRIYLRGVQSHAFAAAYGSG